MGREQIIVGLEIGTSKVAVVVGEAGVDGPIRILGVGQAPSRGVRKGEIVDFEMAHKCVREALHDAEEKSDVTIEKVFLGVTGAHIQSFNNRGSVNLPDDRDEIDPSDCEDVAISARDVSIPQPNAFVHTVLQHYYVNGQEGVVNPVGMLGPKLEADFHIIHGVGNRIKNTVRCVREIGLEVDDIVFTGLAAAQVVLTPQQKELGALMIDIGGGTTEYVLYKDGAIRSSGVLAVGGDHITNDISLGLRIPMAKAEKLKVEIGDVTPDAVEPGETVFLKDETGFAGREIDLETLNLIIRCRVTEILQMIRKAAEGEINLSFLGAGVFLTGGCSHLKGIHHLAEEVFHLPVYGKPSSNTSGLTAASANPQLSVGIGLLRYAQVLFATQPETGGLFSRVRKLFGRR